MKKKVLICVFVYAALGLVFIPNFVYGQVKSSVTFWEDTGADKWTSSSTSYSSSSHSRKKDKETWEERREAERQNQLRKDLRNSSSLLSYIDDADYRWMILHESEFRDQFRYQLLNSKDIVDYFMDDDELRKMILSDNSLFQRLKTRMLENPDRILDYVKDSDLKKIILSDSELKYVYVKQDITTHPDNLSDYINDPDFKKIFDEDINFKAFVSDKVAEKIIAEQKAQKQRELEAQAAAKRKEQEYLAEQQRIEAERQRAIEQAKQNEQQKQIDIAHSQELKSMIVPRQDKGLKNNGVDNEIDAFNVLYEDMVVNKAKKTSAVYSTQDGLNKALEDAGIRAKIELKKKQKEWQGKVVSIPIGKANELMDKTLEAAYPGEGMWKKVKVSQAVRKDEEGLVSTVFKCIAKEGVEAVASGDMKKFNECINQAKESFLDKTGAHIADLTHTKNFRKIYKWFTKTEQNDEEY